MASEPIDEAFVEIKPDLKNFDRDVKRELDASFGKIEDKIDRLTNTIEHQFDRLIAELDVHFTALQHIAEDTFDEIQSAARGAGESIATDIEVGTRIAKHEIDDLADNAHHDFNRIQRDARGSGFSIAGIFSSMGKSISKMVSGIGDSVSSIGSSLSSSLGSTIGQVGSSIGTVTGGIGGALQVAAWTVAIPLVLGLAGALSQLVGILAALPAAGGVALAAILPLILAFHGFSDAIGAVIDGDPKKINEALKKLSPSAAAVTKEFAKLVKPFSEIQKIAQESFFKPLVGTLTQLANAVLPALRAGVGPVAAAFGNMFAMIGKTFANSETTGVLNKLFASTARIINNLSPIITNLLDVTTHLFVDGLPFVERFFGAIGKGITFFSDWLAKAIDGDKVVGWLEKAWQVGKLTFEVIVGVLQYLGTLIGSFADEGTDTLNGINDGLKKMNAYFKTSAGQETLHNLGVLVHWAGNAFVFLLNHMTEAWLILNGFFNFVRGIGPFFANLGTWIINAWNSVISFFKSTGSDIGSFFSNTWTTIVNDVRTFITNVGAAIQAFPAMVKQFLIDSIHTAAYAIGFAIGSIVEFFLQIPNALIALGGWLWNLWKFIVDTTTNGVLAVIDWVGKLPGRIWESLVHVYNLATSVVSNIWHAVVNYFRNLVNDVVAEVRRLPGQISSAFSSLLSLSYNVGQDIVRGIVNGMRSLAGWLYNQAKSLAHDAWQGAKDALGISSPSKEFAKLGKWSVQGFAEGFDAYDLDTAIARSIKMPLDSFASRQQNITSSPTNVNVGGASVTAYLSIDGQQLHPVVVNALYDNSQDVALAAEQGATNLARRR